MEFGIKALRTENFRALCREYGISAKTGYKWRERMLQLGLEGMSEESRRPHKSPEAVSEGEVCAMVALKVAHPHWGPRKIRALYLRQHGKAASESSFKRVLERAGLTRRRRVRRADSGGRINSGQRAEEPNAVWTVDFKGWWRTGAGRCEPLTVRDECSRYVLEVRAMEGTGTEVVRPCFERLFQRYGLPGAIRSDNGSPFAHSRGLLGLSRLSVWWVALGINLERGRPGCPQDNGGHERMHRDISLEVQAMAAGGSQAALDLWREEFNEQRPHEALEMKVPADIYRKSVRRYEGTPEQLEYPDMIRRRVSGVGYLKWEGDSIFLTHSLAGWDVGLKPAGSGRLEVWFGRLLLGYLDSTTASFQRGASPPLEAGHPTKKH